jgi:hypothetical protein
MNTPQYIFDRVVNHLATQRERAYTVQCCYKTPDGKMCAVGCLIKSEDYQPALEGQTMWATAVRTAVSKSLGIPPLEPEDELYLLLSRLQGVHDHARNVVDLQDRLYTTAKMYNLNNESVEMITSWKKN